MIHEALKSLRLFHGLRQVVLAEQIGVTQSGIARIERQLSGPSKRTIEKYAKRFRVPISSILFLAKGLQDIKSGRKVNWDAPESHASETVAGILRMAEVECCVKRVDPQEIMLKEAMTAIRMFHDLTVEGLADKSGISKASIYRFEAGESFFTLGTLLKYSATFDIPLSSIFYLAEEFSKAKRGKHSSFKISDKAEIFLKVVRETARSEKRRQA